eukprot:9629-Pelagococcus_subviridis.AAC.13
MPRAVRREVSPALQRHRVSSARHAQETLRRAEERHREVPRAEVAHDRSHERAVFERRDFPLEDDADAMPREKSLRARARRETTRVRLRDAFFPRDLLLQLAIFPRDFLLHPRFLRARVLPARRGANFNDAPHFQSHSQTEAELLRLVRVRVCFFARLVLGRRDESSPREENQAEVRERDRALGPAHLRVLSEPLHREHEHGPFPALVEPPRAHERGVRARLLEHAPGAKHRGDQVDVLRELVIRPDVVNDRVEIRRGDDAREPRLHDASFVPPVAERANFLAVRHLLRGGFRPRLHRANREATEITLLRRLELDAQATG